MQQLSLYLIKMLVCSAVLLGYYWIALRNERFHHWNRFYLLIALLLSILIPFINISLVAEEEPGMVVYMVSSMPWNNVTIVGSPSLLTWNNALWAVSITISLALLLLVLRSVIKVIRLYHNHEHLDMATIRLVLTGEKTAPFSFFNWLFWRKDIDPDSINGNRMLKHELAHIHEKHSVDKLFTELVLIVFWMNPFFWIIKHELFALHEFLADRKAIDQQDGKAFAAMILQAAHPGLSPALSNPFFSSQLKRRLIMITTSPSPKYTYVRRISGFVLMIGIAFLLAFSIENASAQKPPAMGITTENISSVDYDGGESIIYYLKDGSVHYMRTTDAKQKGYWIPPAKTPVKNLPDSIASVKVTTPNGKAIVEYEMKTGKTLNMSVEEAQRKGYFVPPPPPPPAVIHASGSAQQSGVFFRNLGQDSAQRPLIIVDGKELTTVEASHIDESQIVSMSVLKGETGKAQYGEKAKNGVIIIRTKEASHEKQPDPGELINQLPGGMPLGTTRVFVDGKEISAADLEKVNPYIIESVNVLKGNEATNRYGMGAKDGAIEITTKPDKIFTKMENPPQFPGGPEAWNRYLQRNLKYPKEAAEKGLQGVVRVEFITHQDGSLSEIKALNDPGYGLAEEAVRLIKMGPKWKPGEQNGQKVVARTIQTITFRLESPNPLITSSSTGGANYEKVYTKVEKPAEFPGGINEWRRYLETKLRYPIQAQEHGTQGKVELKFLVAKDGTISDVQALNNPGDGLAEEAVRIVKSGPKWIPATNDGKDVASLHSHTITFRLE